MISKGRAFSSLLLALSENRVRSVGPNGEEPTPVVGFGLTPEERARVRALNASAAIVMHYSDNDWSQAQIAGMRAEFEELGVKVVATTDAGFDPAKQVADIRAALKQKPQAIVSIPTDPVATAPAYAEAVAQGVKLVFMDNVPNGMVAGRDYVSAVSADNFGNGVVCADLMAEALHGHGKIGLVYHRADFFVTKQRYDAFKGTIHDSYPNITIVAETGVSSSDFAADAQRLTISMLEAHPDISGVWAVWDVPAEGVVAAARDLGRTDLVVTTVDLGLNVALELARGGLIFGVGAQRPFDQGVAEAELAGYGLIGKPAPPYVVLPALPVSRTSVLEAWDSVYHKAPPEALIQAAI